VTGDSSIHRVASDLLLPLCERSYCANEMSILEERESLPEPEGRLYSTINGLSVSYFVALQI
jgi:hypothetical protein